MPGLSRDLAQKLRWAELAGPTEEQEAGQDSEEAV